jgi:3-deoxy-D-manno-octulosonic-acid transferase
LRSGAGRVRAASGIRPYNVLVVALGLLAAPFALLLLLLKPAWRRGLAGRLGLGWPAAGRRPVLWAHAASVGEVDAIVPLVELWQEHNPHGSVVFSALTSTGCAHARRHVPSAAVVTFPIDAPGLAGRVVRRVAPDLFLFSENEIWPNTLTALERAGVPAVQVSGRLSAGAAATLARFPRFARAVLGRVSCFCVQSEEHRGRLLGLGVAPQRVVVTGSLKGDGRVVDEPPFLAALAAQGRPIVVAGSTHPGEDEAVIGAVRALRAQVDVACILAPRHPQRFDAVAALLEHADLRFVRRSQLPAAAAALRQRLSDVQVLLLDSIGELAGCYSAATAAFIGGTLVPIGGHNLLEAARCGVSIVVGPHLDSVRAIAERLIAAGAATIVPDGAALAAALAADLEPARHAMAGAAARRVAEEEGGSLAATWQAVEGVLRERITGDRSGAAASAPR